MTASMTDNKDMRLADPEVASILDDFLRDPYQTNKKPKPNPQPKENVYFLLDLRLPDFAQKKELTPVPELEERSPRSGPEDSRLPIKYGFLEMLERVHGKDFHTNNPWFNPEVAANRLKGNKKHRKQVRFSTTEISPAFMPHCRRHDFSKLGSGRLHAPACRNATQETVAVLGDHAWHNRVFILESCVKRPSDTSDFYNYNPPYPAEEGYYERSKERSPDDMEVFDSVELRKLQLSRKEENETTDQADHMSAEPDHMSRLEHIVSDHIADHLASPDAYSDDSLTSNSTLKMCDTGDAEFLDPRSADHDADSAFGEDHHVFEMFEPPRFKKPSDSDYCSETKSDTESDIDIADLLDQVSAPDAPIHSMWFNNPAAHHSHLLSNLPGHVLPDTIDSEVAKPPTHLPSTAYRTPWSNDRPSEAVEVKRGSIIGGLLSPQIIKRKISPQVSQQNLSSFMFDSPSPDDVVKNKQESVGSKPGPSSRKY